jgi:outer membrane receptor protein involved in Fe transport
MKLKTHWAIFASLALFALFQLSRIADAAEVNSDQTTNSQEASPTKLKEVVVIGNLNEARNRIVPSLGGTEYTIGTEQINDQSQGVNASFNQVLLRAPGVVEDSFGQLHVRGEHANLQYRINDILIPEGISGFGQELDTRFVDSVSLITGSLPAQYGFRTAGIVDIHTKSGAFDQGGDVSAYFGTFNTFKPAFEYGGSSGAFNYYFTGTYLQDDLGIENPTASYNAIHDQTRQFKGFGYMQYLIDDTSRFIAMLSSSVGHFQIPNTPGLDPVFSLTGVPTFDSTFLNERQNEQNHYGIFAYQKSTDKFDMQASIFTRFSGVVFKPDINGDLIFNGVASQVDRNIFTNGAEFDSSYRFNDHHTLRTGGLFSVSRAKADSTTSVFPTDDMGNQTSTDPFSIVDNGSKTGLLYGIYVQDEWKPIKPLTINFGVRFDGSNAFINEYQFSPRLNIVYKPTDQTTLHAGYARYFTPPPLELINNETVTEFNNTTNASEITESSPVKSERAHYFDLGVSHQFLPGLQMGLDGYLKLAKNQLDDGQFGSALIFSPFNYLHGQVYGGEFTATYKKGGFSGYANLAVSRALGKQIVSGEFLFGQDEFDFINNNYVHLDHDQLFTASAGAAYNFKDTTVYADLLVGSGLRKGFANTESVPVYSPVNLGASHTFKTRSGGIQAVKIRFDIVNLLDEKYELRDGSGIGVGAPQFGMRRGFYAGVNFAFGSPSSTSEPKINTSDSK